MSGGADNTCRGCCRALVLLPSLFSADTADWVSSRAVVYSRALCWEKPDQARLLSHGAVSAGSLRLSQSRCSQCILHEVLNEYKNTQIHKA